MRPLRFSLFWLLLGWAGVGTVIYLSLTSTPIDTTLVHGDKLGHLLAYGVLMGWFVQLYQRRGWLVLHALFLVLMGVALEFLQGMTGRWFEYADMAANSIGVLLGAATAMTPWRDILLRLERTLAGKGAMSPVCSR
jgi:VanZ family protein